MIIGASSRIQYPRWLRRLLRSYAVLPAFAYLLQVVIVTVLAPQLAPHAPDQGDIASRLLPPAWAEGGSAAHWLGTDALGRDILSRLIFGARVSMIVGVAGTLLGAAIGIAVGLIAGYRGGWLDDLLMRVADVQLAFPFILLAIALLVVLGAGIGNLVIVLGLSAWVTFARVTRGQVLALRELEYVEALHALGAGDARILLRTILPNVASALIVVASFAFAEMVLAEAALSFLGLGVPPSTPSWGGMVAEGRDYIVFAWWVITFPGLAIAATVLSVNIVGDWVRDALDTRLTSEGAA